MGWGVGVPAVFRASQVNSGTRYLGQVEACLAVTGLDGPGRTVISGPTL